MRVLDREAIYISFLEQLKNADRRILLLAYDGTMAPFHKDRTHAFPYPEIPPLLTEIMKAGTRLVLVTGRPSRELVMLSGLYPHPEIWGSHGLERLMPNGDYSVVTLPGKEEAALLKSADVVRALGYEANLELKPGGVAVHWRGLDPADAEKLRGMVSQKWKPLIEDHALKLLEFDGGLEIRVSSVDKGYAVKSILKESSPDAAVAYLGDDLTDEDAFLALKDRGLRILVRPQHRPTAADLWLKPPEQLGEFLHQWLLACGGEA
jgi:trehalose 6-phosphate phosphatase